ncbi:MAG: hypothetical protein ACI9IT_001444 [Glaciecola sp.]|jgi:uncharacterized protein (TIGR03382 family)
MMTFNKFTLGLVFIAFTGMANSTVITSLEDATNGGGFFGEVTFTNSGTDKVTITADISSSLNTGITQGDILGLWFDFSDFSSLSGLPMFGGTTPVLVSVFGENSVGSSISGNLNINGAGATNWDLAVKVGENGPNGGFVQTLSFQVTLAGLDETQFIGQRVGMRVQSIAGVGGFGGSSKLLGTNTTEVPGPGALALLGLGLVGLGFVRRKTKA